jgi:hypothetical protein
MARTVPGLRVVLDVTMGDRWDVVVREAIGGVAAVELRKRTAG